MRRRSGIVKTRLGAGAASQSIKRSWRRQAGCRLIGLPARSQRLLREALERVRRERLASEASMTSRAVARAPSLRCSALWIRARLRALGCRLLPAEGTALTSRCVAMRVSFVTTVAASRQAAWAFAAEFANIGSWDPGVKAAKKVRGRRQGCFRGSQPRARLRPSLTLPGRALRGRRVGARRAWAARTT